MSFANRDQVRAKVEWEGGIIDALDYGLTAADMPEGDDKLIEAWDKLADAYRALTPLAEAVEQLLDAADEGPA